MLQRSVVVEEHIPLAERTYRIRLHCPEIAQRIVPGQFIMLRLPQGTDPLLGRPFALYDTIFDVTGQPQSLDIVYLVVGKMTSQLVDVQPGESLEMWGPLGNGFLDLGIQAQINCVAGGIGQTPFLAYAKHLLGLQGYGGQPAHKRTDRVTLYYGIRSGSFAAGVEDFRQLGVEVHLASDDGSVGHKGYVTQLLQQQQPQGPLIGCGPEPMLQALAQLAQQWDRTCHVSLETPMACGFGVCFSCVTAVQTATGWDYKRVCVDGPVFDIKTLKWENPTNKE